MPTSVITGVTGQDGAYLTRQLLERGHKVYGTFRRTSSVNFGGRRNSVSTIIPILS